jgi:xylulokinase
LDGGAWVVAIDLGTSGLKVGAVAETGEILSWTTTELTTTPTPDGGYEQDTDQWWDGIGSGLRAILGSGTVDPGQLLGVGITGQFASTVPVDVTGAAVGRCLTWADDRGGRYARAAFGGAAAGYKPSAIVPWLRYTGGAPSPGGADPSGHALFLRNERPDLYHRAQVLLEPVDFLGLRLTGRAAATPASMVASWLTDNRVGRPVGYVPSLVRLAGRDAAKLPELVPTGSVLGGISVAAARDLGLPAGVPVVTGVPDLHAAYVASGAVEDYAAHFTISTSAWVSCAVPFKKTDVLHQMASVPGLRPGQYLVIDNHETAGACLQWLRDSMLSSPAGDGPGWRPTYDELVDMADSSPPGANGVFFTPWLRGERSPVDDRALRAAFLNVSMSTRQPDLVRAVLEGVALNMRWLVEVADRFTGRRLAPMRVLGGGAQSDLWCRIHADVLGRPVERVANPAVAQLRGVALYALVALRRLELADVPSRTPPHERFDPDPEVSSRYQPIYREFASAYGRLKTMYRRLNGSRPGG